MKKKMFSVVFVLILSLTLTIPSFAYTNEGTFVQDEAEILYASEFEDLEQKAKETSEQYGCGVYIVILEDFNSWGSTPQEAAINYFESVNMGYGTDHNGIQLMLSMADRDYWLLGHGDIANTAMTDYGREEMEDLFLAHFAEDDWNGGFSVYLDQAEYYLETAAAGQPYDVPPRVKPGYFFSYGIGLFIGLVVACIACFAMKSQLKTAIKRTEASDYIPADGVTFTSRSDRYTHTTTTRTKIQSSSSSGGGGTTTSGGYSGSGGKF